MEKEITFFDASIDLKIGIYNGVIRLIMSHRDKLPLPKVRS